jgi:hypothetical protein
MPPRRRPKEPVIISIEWAESLIGLSMKVPQNWWVGCSGYNLHDGLYVSQTKVKQMLLILLLILYR